jgi:molybdate transport system substrate-binding protein
LYLISCLTSILRRCFFLAGFGLCFFLPLEILNAQILNENKINPPIVLAAASVRPALEEISSNYQLLKKVHPKIIYGSSGNFYQQIINGGKFDIFMSADEHLVNQLQEKKLLKNDGNVYVQGKLVFWLSKRVFSDPIGLETLQKSLITKPVNKVAIANPSLAPYGKAAEEVLRKWPNWPEISKKMIMGENIGQVAQFALSGSVQVALLPLSLTMNPEMQKIGFALPVPDELYEPIFQKMALLSNHPEAKDFYQFILDKQNKKIWEKYGFTAPN